MLAFKNDSKQPDFRQRNMFIILGYFLTFGLSILTSYFIAQAKIDALSENGKETTDTDTSANKYFLNLEDGVWSISEKIPEYSRICYNLDNIKSYVNNTVNFGNNKQDRIFENYNDNYTYYINASFVSQCNGTFWDGTSAKPCEKKCEGMWCGASYYAANQTSCQDGYNTGFGQASTDVCNDIKTCSDLENYINTTAFTASLNLNCRTPCSNENNCTSSSNNYVKEYCDPQTQTTSCIDASVCTATSNDYPDGTVITDPQTQQEVCEYCEGYNQGICVTSYIDICTSRLLRGNFLTEK